MKRKIAAIVAADIAGYSRLISEDEEETLRRLQSYRSVFDDFIARSGGRIFNTAGDAVLAEFTSAVDAVRCAVDVQESLRTRNLAYPPSRQMQYRIGVTIGDVVERDGDLLGDGVNIAARLESIATPGGVCVSRAVYEAVSNKLSVKFADIGAQQVKNIPNPIHAFSISLGERNISGVSLTQVPETQTNTNMRKPSNWPLLAAVSAGGLLFVSMGALAFGLVTAPDWLPWPDALVFVDDDKKKDKPAPKDKDEETETADDRPSTSASVNKPERPENLDITAEAKPEVDRPAQTSTQTKPRPESTAGSGGLPSDMAAFEATLKIRWLDCHGSDLDKAVSACTKLTEDGFTTGPDQARAFKQLARAYRKKKEYDSAITAYTRAIAIDPKAELYNDRGIAQVLNRNYDDAIKDYDEALRREPDNGDALNNRAWTRYQAGQTRTALADADRAVTLLATRAYVWDTRGHIHEQLGNKTEAIRDYKKALEIDPKMTSSTEGLRRLGS